MPRKVFEGGIVVEANQKLSSKSFFVEPRHRKSFGGVKPRRRTSKTTSTIRSGKPQRTISAN
ncbi:MAG: hypothetical protein A3G66_04000 [Candidatus Levybacteria bacterium RIFCSPLOWO2_12_FULL_39_17]|nr:MAG: hypothetical protein A3G66_04000 [Candidatus Levybacteria bacterium RIFCSPLOWO2_12_FULL_39_17]